MNQITKQTTCDRLLDILPHGSGINGNWSIEYNRNTRAYYASNYFEAMNETGMYCHTYYFAAKCRHNGTGKFIPCDSCNGDGVKHIANNEFACWKCDGKGQYELPEWELLNINFHGEREHTCCGYGLRDYLYETLTLS